MQNNGKLELVKIDSLSNITVPSGAMEKLLSVSSRRIRQLADEGILVKAAHGKYSLVPSITNYIKHLKVNNDIENYQADGELSYDIEHAKNERIKRKQNELKYALMKGRLHEAHLIRQVWSELLISFKTKLLGLPSKLAPFLTDQHDVGYIESILTDEVNEVLSELKDYDPLAYQSNDYIDVDVLDDEEEDNDEQEVEPGNS